MKKYTSEYPQSQERERKGIKEKNFRRRNIVLWLFLTILAGSVLYRYFVNGCYITEPIVLNDDRAETLADKINPNTATWASLARLPGIGPGKARAIVRYRDEFHKDNGDKHIVFEESADLGKVKGIGVQTVEQIKEYLVFIDPDKSR